MIVAGNLYAGIVPDRAQEQVAPLVSAPGLRVERIVSTGQASPPGFWYDQDEAEWVVVVAGAAELRIEGEAAARKLAAGDYVLIPAHTRHRVESSDPDRPTIWLAIHYRA